MALLSDYASGTITIAANATSVIGSGTAWQAAGFAAGDLLFADGYIGLVGSVQSDTALTLAQPWRGGALTAAAYRLRYQGDGSRISAQARQLIELLGGSGNLETLGKISGGADRLAYFTGPGQMTTTALTPFARTLLDDLNQSTALATLGAASSSALTTGLAGKLSLTGGALTGDVTISKTYPQIRLNHTDVGQWGMYANATPGQFILQWTPSGGNPTNPFFVGVDGSIYSAQIGDLATALAGKYPNAAGAANASAIATINSKLTLLTGHNYIINGAFDIWQRGTGAFASTGYTADRWLHIPGSGATSSVSMGTFTASDSLPFADTYNLVWTRSVAGSAVSVLCQRIENARTLAGKTVTLTFWASATVATSIQVAIQQYFGTGGSPSGLTQTAMQTAAIGTSGLAKYSYTFTLPTVIGKTFGTNNNHALIVVLNWPVASANASITLSHVSLMEGDRTADANPFPARHFQQELALCQRYFEKRPLFFTGYNVAGANIDVDLPFSVLKRTTPTFAFGSASYANASGLALVAVDSTRAIARITVTSTGSATLNSNEWTADAEL